MQSLTRWFSPTGAAIIAIGFFLPWFQVACVPNPKKPPVAKVQVTGYQLATGAKPASVQELFDSFLTGMVIKNFIKRWEKKTQRKIRLFEKRWLLWGVLLFALLTGGLGLLLVIRGPTKLLRYAGTASWLATLICLLTGLAQNTPPRSGSGGRIKLPESLWMGLDIGGWMLLVGLTLALLGFWITKELPKEPHTTPH